MKFSVFHLFSTLSNCTSKLVDQNAKINIGFDVLNPFGKSVQNTNLTTFFLTFTFIEKNENAIPFHIFLMPSPTVYHASNIKSLFENFTEISYFVFEYRTHLHFTKHKLISTEINVIKLGFKKKKA